MRSWTAAVLLFLLLLPLASAQLTPNIWKKFIGEPVPVGVPDLIDFSYAGYKMGEAGIPEDFGYTVYNVTDYGAIPDDGKSDVAAIHATLSAAAAGRSIVFFPPGHYDVFLDDDRKDGFIIGNPNVVIRGSGAQGARSGGTTIKLHAELPEEYLFATRVAPTGYTVATRVSGAFPNGIEYFDVTNATQLRGHKYIFIRKDNLSGAAYSKYSSRPLSEMPAAYTRIQQGVHIKEFHEIDRIEGNRIYLKAPLIAHLEPGTLVWSIDLLEGVGFEDLHIDGGFDETYIHLVQTGRSGVLLRDTAHSWIRRCRFSNTISSFVLSTSYCSSAVSVIVDGRFGHELGSIGGSTYCMIAFLEDHTDKGMVHGVRASHYAAGSVVWYVGGPSARGPDTHGQMPRHSLFDNYNSVNHQSSGSGIDALPHHLDGYTRWNNTVRTHETFDLWTPVGYGFTATQGNLIGYKTLGGSLPRDAYFEAFGTRVSPDSLYAAQLAVRLGTQPPWVNTVKDRHTEFIESIFGDSSQSNAPTAAVDPASGGPKIEGPWLWVLVPDERLERNTDLLAKVSGGTITAAQIATTGALRGDRVGDYAWTPLKIGNSPNNINTMTQPLGWNGNNRVIYGTITLNSPRVQNTRMFVGSDDTVKVWLNGDLVREEIVYRAASDYQGAFPVTLKRGRNTVLVAVGNGGGGWTGFFGFQADAEYTVLSFADIRYVLPDVDIYVGDTFMLDIYAKDVVDLAGWQFDIAFDPLRLEAIEVRSGHFLQVDNGLTAFQEGTIDNRAGKIRGIRVAQRAGNSVSGTGLLVSTRFSAKAGGTAAVALENFEFIASNGQEIPSSPQRVTLVVKGSLKWDVNGDGRVNVLDIVLIAQNIGRSASDNPRVDVNGDGTINILDIILVAQHLDESATAAPPSTVAITGMKGVAPAMVEAWIGLARAEDDGSIAFQRGIAYLERLLAFLIPKNTRLMPNYPNPFNPETWIPYQLAKPAEVTVTIYTADGKLVRRLSLGHQSAGVYERKGRAGYWDGRNTQGEPVASGVYFYTLTAGDFTATHKMLIRR